MKFILKFFYLFKTKNFWQLIYKIISNPLFAFGTFRATYQAVYYAQMYFPFQHSNHSKGNAFRHSLWNALIVNDCITFFCSFEKSLNWAEEITSYHEKAFINEGLPKAMDLHNNQIGRFYFSQLYKQYNSKISTKQIVDYILNQSQYTVKLSQIEEIQTSIFMVCLE